MRWNSVAGGWTAGFIQCSSNPMVPPVRYPGRGPVPWYYLYLCSTLSGIRVSLFRRQLQMETLPVGLRALDWVGCAARCPAAGSKASNSKSFSAPHDPATSSQNRWNCAGTPGCPIVTRWCRRSRTRGGRRIASGIEMGDCVAQDIAAGIMAKS